MKHPHAWLGLGVALLIASCGGSRVSENSPSGSQVETQTPTGSQFTTTPATADSPTNQSSTATSTTADSSTSQSPAATASSGGSTLTQSTPEGGSSLQVQPVAGSYLTSKKATASNPQVQTTLNQLDARETDRGTVIALPGDVLFDFDKATIRPDAAASLAKINQLISYYGKVPVAIEGHTDSKGSDSYNQDLSQRRAESVRTYLAKQFGVSVDRLKTQGFGETRPAAANTNPNGSDNPTGRQLNRRVEVIIQNKT